MSQERIINGVNIDANTGNRRNREVSKRSTSQGLTSGQKWWAAILIGLLFALFSSSLLYSVTHSVSTSVGGPALSNGGPTVWGLIIHTIIFTLIVRLIMW